MPGRLHYIDSTRALASILGVFYHASLVFSHGWLVNSKDLPLSGSMYALHHVLTYFRMPLFLIVSGFFTAYGIKKYLAEEFIKPRARRILLPFVSSMLILLPIQLGFSAWNQSPEHVWEVFLASMNPISHDFRLGHLWFLYFIIIFSALCFAEWHLFRKSRMQNTSSEYSLLRTLMLLAGIWFAEQILAAATLFVGEMLPLKDSWLEISKMARCFPIFYLGYLSYHRKNMLTGIHRLGPCFLVLGALLYWPIGHLADTVDSWFLASVLKSVLTWLLTLGVFHLAKRTLDFSNGAMDYLSEGSYGVYLLHQPVIVVVASIFLRFFDVRNAWAGYGALVTISLFLTYLLYHLIIRNTRLGGYLFTGTVRK